MGLYYGSIGVFTPQVEQMVLDTVSKMARTSTGKAQ